MSNFNRRNFLQMIGIGTASAIVAPIITSPTVVSEVAPKADFSRQSLTAKGGSTDMHSSHMFDNPHNTSKAQVGLMG